jgi:hypothetical protein
VIRLKKVLSSLVIVLAVIFAAIVATPFTAIQVWFGDGPGLIVVIAINNEMYLKAGIIGFFFVASLAFLFVSGYELKSYGSSSRQTLLAVILPPLLLAFSALVNTVPKTFINFYSAQLLDKISGLVIIFVLVNLFLFFHFLIGQFLKAKRGLRVYLYIFAVELLLGAAYFAYLTALNPGPSLDTSNFIFLLPAFIVFILIHLIVFKIRSKRTPVEESLEVEVKEIKQQAKEIQVKQELATQPDKKLSKSEEKQLAKQNKVVERREAGGKKTLIVSREQTIISSEHDVDPTNMLYEEVTIDPEFNKTANLDKQVSTIEYYIEKPKLFKPLDPPFDELVQYIRDLPTVVTKIADERITFYVDRKPFLVLMNFGNYYRMVFRADLEKGIRLIIKYPTISKNKASKDELWFKANNYGDLPKEVVYDICKSAYDNVNL